MCAWCSPGTYDTTLEVVSLCGGGVYQSSPNAHSLLHQHFGGEKTVTFTSVTMAALLSTVVMLGTVWYGEVGWQWGDLALHRSTPWSLLLGTPGRKCLVASGIDKKTLRPRLLSLAPWCKKNFHLQPKREWTMCKEPCTPYIPL